MIEKFVGAGEVDFSWQSSPGSNGQTCQRRVNVPWLVEHWAELQGVKETLLANTAAMSVFVPTEEQLALEGRLYNPAGALALSFLILLASMVDSIPN